MQQTILAISGKPGLYKLVSRGKMNLIVEALDDTHKRIPAFATDRVTSLADITMFTESEDLPLGTILARVRDKEACQAAPPSTGARHRQRNSRTISQVWFLISTATVYTTPTLRNSFSGTTSSLLPASPTSRKACRRPKRDNIADRDDEAAQPAESKE